jgi:hypothetical protein
LLHACVVTQPCKVEIEIVIGEKLVRERRTQLALLKRKPIVLEELKEQEAGQVFLGEISLDEN